MSQSYEGPANLHLGDAEIAVTADLSTYRDGRFNAWEGTLHLTDAADSFHDYFEAGSATIRMPDGREATVVLRDAGYSGTVEIQGSSVPPF